jgi:hypothetical protein
MNPTAYLTALMHVHETRSRFEEQPPQEPKQSGFWARVAQALAR